MARVCDRPAIMDSDRIHPCCRNGKGDKKDTAEPVPFIQLDSIMPSFTYVSEQREPFSAQDCIIKSQGYKPGGMVKETGKAS